MGRQSEGAFQTEPLPRIPAPCKNMEILAYWPVFQVLYTPD